MATQGIGATAGANPALKVATTTYDAADLATLVTIMTAQTHAVVKSYQAATTPEAKQAVLAGQTISGTIDQFVSDVALGKLRLPDGVDPLSAVAPVIKPLLEAGLGYAVTIPFPWRSHEFNFSLEPKDGYRKDASGVYIELAKEG